MKAIQTACWGSPFPIEPSVRATMCFYSLMHHSRTVNSANTCSSTNTVCQTHMIKRSTMAHDRCFTMRAKSVYFDKQYCKARNYAKQLCAMSVQRQTSLKHITPPNSLKSVKRYRGIIKPFISDKDSCHLALRANAEMEAIMMTQLLVTMPQFLLLLIFFILGLLVGIESIDNMVKSWDIHEIIVRIRTQINGGSYFPFVDANQNTVYKQLNDIGMRKCHCIWWIPSPVVKDVFKLVMFASIFQISQTYLLTCHIFKFAVIWSNSLWWGRQMEPFSASLVLCVGKKAITDQLASYLVHRRYMKGCVAIRHMSISWVYFHVFNNNSARNIVVIML